MMKGFFNEGIATRKIEIHTSRFPGMGRKTRRQVQ